MPDIDPKAAAAIAENDATKRHLEAWKRMAAMLRSAVLSGEQWSSTLEKEWLTVEKGELEAERVAHEAMRRIVAEQAEDDGLWFVATTASEAYLQEALRRLHAAVEGDEAMGRLLASAEGGE